MMTEKMPPTTKKRWIQLLVCTILFLSSTPSAFSKITLDDDATISLLTVHPQSKAVYTIFGHTAIRVKSDSLNIDIVYNYGHFDSGRPNFIYHFVRGETDYVLGLEEFSFFRYKYQFDNSYIEEQILHLSIEEKRAVFDFLNNNALPENRGYRYDYFFDNCSTRPRDIIEDLIAGKLIYPAQKETTTLRTLVHECTKPYPWLAFGVDLVIGSGADSTVQLRTEMFLPIKLMEAFDEAVTETDSTSLSIVSQKQTIMLPEYAEETSGGGISPEVAAILILLLTGIITYWAHKKNRLYKGLDITLFTIAGIAGCIVAFICFISTHPCTSQNYNVIWIHPFHLLAAICIAIKSLKRVSNWYHLINFAILSVFLAVWYALPQEIPLAGIIIAACLWLRSGYNVYQVHQERIKFRKSK